MKIMLLIKFIISVICGIDPLKYIFDRRPFALFEKGFGSIIHWQLEMSFSCVNQFPDAQATPVFSVH